MADCGKPCDDPPVSARSPSGTGRMYRADREVSPSAGSGRPHHRSSLASRVISSVVAWIGSLSSKITR